MATLDSSSVLIEKNETHSENKNEETDLSLNINPSEATSSLLVVHSLESKPPKNFFSMNYPSLLTSLKSIYYYLRNPYITLPPIPTPFPHCFPFASNPTRLSFSMKEPLSSLTSFSLTNTLYVYPSSTLDPVDTTSSTSFVTSVDTRCLIWQALLKIHAIPHTTVYTSDHAISPTTRLPCFVTSNHKLYYDDASLLAFLNISNQQCHPFLPMLSQFLFPALIYTAFYEPKNSFYTRSFYTKTIPSGLKYLVYPTLRQTLIQPYQSILQGQLNSDRLYARATDTLDILAATLKEHSYGYLTPLDSSTQRPEFIDVCFFAILHSILSQDLPMEKLRGSTVKHDVFLTYAENLVSTFLSSKPKLTVSTVMAKQA